MEFVLSNVNAYHRFDGECLLMVVNGEYYVLSLRTGSNLTTDVLAVGHHWCFSCVTSWLLPSDSCQLHSKNIHRIIAFRDWPRLPMDNSCFLSS